MNNIEVFMVGSPVIVGDKIPATILSILIKEHNYMQYECSYWASSQRHIGWFEQSEVKRDPKSASSKIGFK